MEQVWNLPGPARPGFFPRLARALLFLVLLGLVVIATTLLAGLSTYGHHALSFVFSPRRSTATVNAGMYFIGFRILTPRGVPSRDLARRGGGRDPWTALQVAGAYLNPPLPAQRLRVRRVRHRAGADGLDFHRDRDHRLLRGDQRGPGPPAVAADVHQPPLTEADRASLALQALQNQRRVEEQQVAVTFDDRQPGSPGPDLHRRPPTRSPRPRRAGRDGAG